MHKHDCPTCRRLTRQLYRALDWRNHRNGQLYLDLFIVPRLLLRINNHRLTCPNYTHLLDGLEPWEIPHPVDEAAYIRAIRHDAEEEARQARLLDVEPVALPRKPMGRPRKVTRTPVQAQALAML
jgi:hypothetical protein